jgi:hypothetical protein
MSLLFGVACLPLFYALHRRLHPRTATAGNSLATVCPLPDASKQRSSARLSSPQQHVSLIFQLAFTESLLEAVVLQTQNA